MRKEKDYLKQMIIYGNLLTTVMLSLIIPVIGLFINLIICIIYDVFIGTGVRQTFTPLVLTILIMAPLIYSFVVAMYCVIRFTYAKIKITSKDYSKLNINKEEIDNNLKEAKDASDLYYTTRLLNTNDSNLSTIINTLTIFNISKKISGNSKILNKNNILTKKDMNILTLFNIILLIIPISFILVYNIDTIVSSQKNKHNIEYKINSINSIIENSFSDYELHTFTSQNKLNIKYFSSFGFYIMYQNEVIDFELDNEANIEKVRISLSFNEKDSVNANDIRKRLQIIKNKIDKELGVFYLIKGYKNFDIIFNEDCINYIENKTYDSVLIDRGSFFSINNSEDGDWEVSYSFGY